MCPKDPFDTAVITRRTFGAFSRNLLNIGNGQDNPIPIIRWIERSLIEVTIALMEGKRYLTVGVRAGAEC
ncbi:MAG: hypothetical protein ACM3ZQ_01505 [Bacillota bacterium]